MINSAQQIKKLFLGLFVIGLFVYSFIRLFTPAHAQQQTQRTIVITPPTVEQSLKPGDRAEGILKVINDGAETITFTVSTQDFIVDNKGGSPDLLAPNTLAKKYSATAWIGIYPDTFTVAPHQKQIVNYYIQIPPDARPGGHYAAIIYQPSNPLGVQGTGTGVNTYIGSLFYIDVAGPIHEEAKVVNFNAGGFYEYGPAKIFTEIQNFGDLHIKPLGDITISDVFHRDVITVPLEEHNIFPGAIRDFSNVVGQQWMVGPFTAKLYAKYGRADNLVLVATTTFWVFPWKVAVVIVLIIIAIILGVLLWKKRNEKEDSQENSPKIPNNPTSPIAQ